ncbi:MAG: hypothetical protein ACREJ3_02290, partial [Polyangiaceae bacterium]
MEGPERKTSIEGDPTPTASEAAADAPASDLLTPEAASISGPTGGGDRGTGAAPVLPAKPATGLRAWPRWAARATAAVPIRARAALAIVSGAAALASAFVAVRSCPSATTPKVSAAVLAASVSGMDRLLPDAFDDAGAGDSAALSATDADTTPARSVIWRVASLQGDPGTAVVDIVAGRRPLLAAIRESEWSHGSRFSSSAAESVVAPLASARGSVAVDPKDTLTIALDKAKGSVVAFEFANSPTEVWQGREEPQSDGSTKIQVKKLDLPLRRVRVRKAVLVGAELHKSFVDAGLAPIDDLLTMLDDALDGHAELSDIRPGARLRLIATQDRADDTFVRWVSLEAVEYFPASPNASPVRVYRFDPDQGDPTSKRHHGWYDA